MLNKKSLIIILIVTLIFLINSVSAISFPHAFYGEVNYSNGEKVNTGEIITKINENIVGSTVILDGEYNLIIESEYGGLIKFYFNNENLGNYTFKEFEVTRLDFIINIEQPTPPVNDTEDTEDEDDQEEDEEEKDDNDDGDKELVRGEFCRPNWECSGWSSCVSANEVMTRECYDTNYCDVSYDKPIERTLCDTGDELEGKKLQSKVPSFQIFLFSSMALILVLILLILIVNKRKD